MWGWDSNWIGWARGLVWIPWLRVTIRPTTIRHEMPLPESSFTSRRRGGEPTQWNEVAKQALIELGRHGPDGLFVVLMFALLLIAAWREVNALVSLLGLGICCTLYLAPRMMNLRHAVTMARLQVDQQAARVASVKAPFRPASGGTQQSLPLERRSRLSGRNGDDPR